jgi:tRNA modification GTPase
MEDTIAAISTPLGQGGIAIIRMSGTKAVSIADKLFRSRDGLASNFPTHTIHHGRIVKDGGVLDEVLLSVMRAPQTYTGEDTIEINCHGGVVNARLVLGVCLEQGARLAEAGEFTKRAFLNGKMDLAQAESVMDLISAQTDLSHAGAINVHTGKFTKRIQEIEDQLLTIIAHLEAHIDFPDEDITPHTRTVIQKQLDDVVQVLDNLAASSREGKILRSGVRVAIVGRPNAGKSSLLNALLREERAIVTPHPGTTRDTLEETADIRGMPIHFTDTAGIRSRHGHIESKGIERTHKALAECDICIYILDGSRPYSVEEKNVHNAIKPQKTICIINKADLRRKLILPADFPYQDPIAISSITGFGLESLKDRIEHKVWNGKAPDSINCFILNERHTSAITGAKKHLIEARTLLSNELSIEICAQSVKLGLDAIGDVTGKKATEDILDRIFSSFCIGK